MLGRSFFFGVQFFCMGLMGEYLSRIYLESVQRPTFFIADRIGGVKTLLIGAVLQCLSTEHVSLLFLDRSEDSRDPCGLRNAVRI